MKKSVTVQQNHETAKSNIFGFMKYAFGVLHTFTTTCISTKLFLILMGSLQG